MSDFDYSALEKMEAEFALTRTRSPCEMCGRLFQDVDSEGRCENCRKKKRSKISSWL